MDLHEAFRGKERFAKHRGIGLIGAMVLVLPVDNMVTDGAQQVIVHPNLIITYVYIKSIGVCVDRMSWVTFGGAGDRTIGFAHIA